MGGICPILTFISFDFESLLWRIFSLRTIWNDHAARYLAKGEQEKEKSRVPHILWETRFLCQKLYFVFVFVFVFVAKASYEIIGSSVTALLPAESAGVDNLTVYIWLLMYSVSVYTGIDFQADMFS